MENDVSAWIRVDAERVLYIHRGRDVILCTEHSFPNGAEFVLRLSDKAKDALQKELILKSAPLAASSLPSGESDPSVKLDFNGADT